MGGWVVRLGQREREMRGGLAGYEWCRLVGRVRRVMRVSLRIGETVEKEDWFRRKLVSLGTLCQGDED